jgi:predicted Zn-dependent protease
MAIGEYRQVATLTDRPGIHFRLGQALLALGGENAASEALREFQQEIRVDPTNTRAAYEIGEILRRTGQVEKALEYLAKVVEQQPDFEDGQIGYARALVEIGQPAKARPPLEAAVKLNPDNEVIALPACAGLGSAGDKPAQQRELQNSAGRATKRAQEKKWRNCLGRRRDAADSG